MGLALYRPRVRSSEVLGDLGLTPTIVITSRRPYSRWRPRTSSKSWSHNSLPDTLQRSVHETVPNLGPSNRQRWNILSDRTGQLALADQQVIGSGSLGTSLRHSMPMHAQRGKNQDRPAILGQGRLHRPKHRWRRRQSRVSWACALGICRLTVELSRVRRPKAVARRLERRVSRRSGGKQARATCRHMP